MGGRKRVVLVVEDDQPIGEMLRDVINDEKGYLAVHVRRPSDAVRAAHTVHPDLMLLDIGLPEMSGFELYDKMQRDPTVPDVPVIFETAIAEENVREFRRRGIHDVLQKPFELADLLRRVHDLAPVASNGSP